MQLKTNYFFNIIIVLIFLCNIEAIYGQRNFTLYHLEGIPQTHYMNPSFRPSSAINISLPLGMQSVGLSHNGFTLGHLLHERSQDDSLDIRPEIAIEEMKELNHINLDVQNELLGFGFRLGQKNFFSFSATHRMQLNFLYPKDLFRLAFEGNGGSLLGERASFDGFGLNLNSYMEYAFGYNRIIWDSLMVGARVKFISGITNIHTEKSVLGLYTDPDNFELTVDASTRVNSSNVSHILERVYNDELPVEYAYNFNNFGIGFDLGASYAINDKFLLSASVNDLGFINWKTNNVNYVSDDIDYTFRGVELSSFIQDSVDGFNQAMDSIENVFAQTQNNDSYTTSLYTRFYLGGRYQINDKIGATVLMYNEIVNKKYRAGLYVGVNAKLGEWLSASVNYGYYGRSWSNLGIGFSLRGGPVQYFLGLDNINAIINPYNHRNVHVTTGLGVMIGKPDKDREKSSVKFL